jgi:hypothetical protein
MLDGSEAGGGLSMLLGLSSVASLALLLFSVAVEFWDIFSKELRIVLWTLLGLGAGFWKLSILLLLLVSLVGMLLIGVLRIGLDLTAADLLLHMASCLDSETDD